MWTQPTRREGATPQSSPAAGPKGAQPLPILPLKSDFKREEVLVLLSGCVGFGTCPDTSQQANLSAGFSEAFLPLKTRAAEMVMVVMLSMTMSRQFQLQSSESSFVLARHCHGH